MRQLLQELVPGLTGQPPTREPSREEDLEVDLAVRHIDTTRVIERIGIITSATKRILDPRSLRDTEAPTLPDDTSPQDGSIDSDRVIRWVTALAVRLRGCLAIGSDPTIPDQLDCTGQER